MNHIQVTGCNQKQTQSFSIASFMDLHTTYNFWYSQSRSPCLRLAKTTVDSHLCRFTKPREPILLCSRFNFSPSIERKKNQFGIPSLSKRRTDFSNRYRTAVFKTQDFSIMRFNFAQFIHELYVVNTDVAGPKIVSEVGSQVFIVLHMTLKSIYFDYILFYQYDTPCDRCTQILFEN